MPILNWLHFSDSHFGLEDQKWLWPKIRAELLSDLRKLHDIAGPWHVVFVSGDVAQSGKNEEFDAASKELDTLWQLFESLGSNPVVVAVPGNHDLVRPPESGALVKAFSMWHTDSDVRQAFWSDKGSDYRCGVEACFANYVRWWDKVALPKPEMTNGMLPGDFSALVRNDNLTLGIVGLNSTFLQLAKGDFEGQLDIHEKQLHQVCAGDPSKWIEASNIAVLVTHQSAEWLHPQARDRFNCEIYPPGRFFSQICGHLHEARASETREAGAKPRRIRQAPSLFGLTDYEQNGACPRRHGYTAGRFEIKDGKGIERLWPRILIRTHAGDMRIKADQGYELDDVESVTTEFEVQKTATAPSTATRKKASGHDEGVTAVVGENSLIETTLDEAAASRKLQGVPRLRLTALPQHSVIRKEEQARFEVAARKARCVWVVSEWGFGRNGFLATALERLRPGVPIGDVFHVRCEGAENVEQLQTLIAQQFGMALQTFCAHCTALPSAFLVLDEMHENLCGYGTGQGNAEALNRVLRLILDYCPSLTAVLTSSSRPVVFPFEFIELRALELPEVREYLGKHPDSSAGLQDPDVLEKLHEHSEGLPTHLDRILKGLKVTSLKEVLDAEFEGHSVRGEMVPKSLMQSVASLSRSEDNGTRRSVRLLKVLSVLSSGEPIERIKHFFPGQPFRIDNAIQLSELSLLDIIPAHASIPQIETQIPVQVGSEIQSPKILRVPRQVRDCVQQIISSDEKLEIAKAGAELFFGRRWREGKLKFREPLKDIAVVGPGNELAVIHHLLHEAINARDQLGMMRAGRLASSYCQYLRAHDRFRDACLIGEATMHLVEKTNCNEQTIDLAIPYGVSLRMTNHLEESVRILTIALDLGGEKIPKSTRGSMYLNIALVKQTRKEFGAAIEAAEKAKELTHPDSATFMQAVITIECCTKKDNELTQSLKTLHASTKTAGHQVLANNIAIDLASETEDSAEALRLLDGVIRSRGDEYNRIRAIVEKAEILREVNRIEDLASSERALLTAAYTYLHSQRLSNLFNRCHSAVWGVLQKANLVAQLLRLFRHSSFIWRLRGESDRESKCLKELEAADPVNSLSKNKEIIRVELDYFERRRRAVGPPPA